MWEQLDQPLGHGTRSVTRLLGLADRADELSDRALLVAPRQRELAADAAHLRRITAGSSLSVTLMVTTMLSMAPNGSVAVTTTV